MASKSVITKQSALFVRLAVRRGGHERLGFWRPAVRPSSSKFQSGLELPASTTKRFSTVTTTKPQHPVKDILKGRARRDLHGKVAIVTGAGSQGDDIGNGRAISILLAEDGASVVCVDKDVSLAQRTASIIHQALKRRGKPESPPAALAIQADVTNESDCRRIVDTAVSSFGRLDILVNVVGVMGAHGTAVDLNPEEWAWGLEINVTSMMLMSRAAIPAMLQNQRREENGSIRGSIVNIGSVAGLRGGTRHLLYPTSKGAVVNMTRAMAAHHGRDGIRVNCVCPGMLFTPMMAGGMTDEMREARKKRSLLGTEGNAWDCASAVRFLAGDEARWITGSILTVDAGATAAVALSSPV